MATTTRTFGDELNPFLWDKLFDKKKFADAPGALLGIGTILNEAFLSQVPMRPVTVFGSGAGYHPLPKDEGLDVMFVRGPKSAQLIRYNWNRSVEWITDPGILVAHFRKGLAKDRTTSFVPHWTTYTQQEGLVEALRSIGVYTVNPTAPVEQVLKDIERSELVIAEALHGAVVADAFRIPWIPVYGQHGHLFKWLDWCDSIGVQYDPAFFETSSMKSIMGRVPSVLSNQARHDTNLRRLDIKVEELRRKIA